MRFRLPNALLATGLLLSSAIVALGGCAPSPLHLDPLNTSGRDGGGPPLTYPALMRIGDAAYHAGDFANAVNLYRRAAQLAPRDPAPFVALAAALLRMDKVDEAILADNSALARDPQNLPALQGLAKAYLPTGPNWPWHRSTRRWRDSRTIRNCCCCSLSPRIRSGNTGRRRQSIDRRSSWPRTTRRWRSISPCRWR